MIQCGRLDPPLNGDLSFLPGNFPPYYDYLTVVTYLCNVGWYRDGAQSRQCRGNGDTMNGFWNGNPAICLRESFSVYVRIQYKSLVSKIFSTSGKVLEWIVKGFICYCLSQH